ncbi:MAG: roadblock/LC7 domain-containing protein [Candidatus Woesearchaeota archaeon]
MRRYYPLVVGILLFSLFILADSFVDDSPSDFDEGTYYQTFYNTTANFIQLNLSEGFDSGNYTSKVFDAGSVAQWDNLGWYEINYDTEYLFAADNHRDLWRSSDLGVTWIEINGVFRFDGDDIGGITSNSDGLFIITRQGDRAVYKSTDSGAIWTLLNDTAFPEDPRGITTDSDNNLYATVKNKRIYKSTDSGATWTLINDAYSDENTDNQYGILAMLASLTNISVYTHSCDDSDCVGESWNGPYINSTLVTLSEIDNQFFQYRVEFETSDISFSPELYNVTISYTILNSAPTITSASDSPDPVDEGSDVTFSVDWDDADAGDKIKVHLCKTDAITGQVCDGGSWCDSSTFTTSNPESCAYTTSASDIGVQDYYAYVCDDDNACSSSSSGTFTVNDVSPNLPPVIESNRTIVNNTIATPVFGDSFFVQVNVSDTEGDTIEFVSFTITSPDGTDVVDNQLGNNFTVGDYSIWNSTSCTVDDYGIWNFSYSVSDGTNTVLGNVSFFVYSDISIFPAEYIVAPDPKNQTLIWNLSLYHQSSDIYELNFSYDLNETYFTLTFTNNSANISNAVFNTSNLFKNQVVIDIDDDVLDETSYEGNITIRRINDGTDFIVPLTIGVNPPSGNPEALTPISRIVCGLGTCDVDLEMENDESLVVSWMLNNTGNYDLTGCIPTITGFDISNFGEFSDNDFSVGVDESITLTLTLSQPSINSYYGRLEVVCEATVLGYSTSLGAEDGNAPNINLVVRADTGTGGGGGIGTGGGGSPRRDEIAEGVGVDESQRFTNFPDFPTGILDGTVGEQGEEGASEERVEDQSTIGEALTNPVALSTGSLVVLLLLLLLAYVIKKQKKKTKALSKVEAKKALEKYGFRVMGKETKKAVLVKVLKGLIGVGDVSGVSVISKEGLIIASNISAIKKAEKFSATSALMVNSARESLAKLGRGGLNHIIINTKTKRFVAVTAGKKAILVCLVKPKANLGFILLEIKKAANKIAKALE